MTEGKRSMRGEEADQWAEENPDLIAMSVAWKEQPWCETNKQTDIVCTLPKGHEGKFHLTLHSYGKFEPGGHIEMCFA